MKDIDLICFDIISNVGSARSYYIEAIQEAKTGDYDKCSELISAGDECFRQGHHAHAKLIQEEASGNGVDINLLLIHAEDQLMSAEGFKILCEEFIDLYKRIDK